MDLYTLLGIDQDALQTAVDAGSTRLESFLKISRELTLNDVRQALNDVRQEKALNDTNWADNFLSTNYLDYVKSFIHHVEIKGESAILKFASPSINLGDFVIRASIADAMIFATHQVSPQQEVGETFSKFHVFFRMWFSIWSKKLIPDAIIAKRLSVSKRGIPEVFVHVPENFELAEIALTSVNTWLTINKPNFTCVIAGGIKTEAALGASSAQPVLWVVSRNMGNHTVPYKAPLYDFLKSELDKGADRPTAAQFLTHLKQLHSEGRLRIGILKALFASAAIVLSQEMNI